MNATSLQTADGLTPTSIDGEMSFIVVIIRTGRISSLDEIHVNVKCPIVLYILHKQPKCHHLSYHDELWHRPNCGEWHHILWNNGSPPPRRLIPSFSSFTQFQIRKHSEDSQWVLSKTSQHRLLKSPTIIKVQSDAKRQEGVEYTSFHNNCTQICTDYIRLSNAVWFLS